MPDDLIRRLLPEVIESFPIDGEKKEDVRRIPANKTLQTNYIVLLTKGLGG